MSEQPVNPIVVGPRIAPTYPIRVGYGGLIHATGEKSLRLTTSGFEQFSRSVGPPRQSTTLIVRREQVQTVEETYRFVGSNLAIDRIPDVHPTPDEGNWMVSDVKLDPASGEPVVSPERVRISAAPAIEIIMFMIVGGLCAILISPYSPFKTLAPLLMMIVMPTSVIGAFLYAVYCEYGRRTIG